MTVAGAATSARPTKAFRSERDALLRDERAGAVAAGLLTAAGAVPGTRDTGQVPPEVGDVLRGLAWIAAAGGGEDAARALGQFALAGWKKVPDYGPLCKKAANAAIVALAQFPEGAPQLGRLRAQLKPPAAVSTVDAAIEDAAGDARGSRAPSSRNASSRTSASTLTASIGVRARRLHGAARARGGRQLARCASSTPPGRR